jgi:hypothetical protein
LFEKVKDYPDDILFVVVLCLNGEPKDFIGRSVDFDAKKMTKYPFTSSLVLSALETNGQPYYLSTVDTTTMFPMWSRRKMTQGK